MTQIFFPRPIKPAAALPVEPAPGIMSGRIVENHSLLERAAELAIKTLDDAITQAVQANDTTRDIETIYQAADTCRREMTGVTYYLDLGNPGFSELRAKAWAMAHSVKRGSHIDISQMNALRSEIYNVTVAEMTAPRGGQGPRNPAGLRITNYPDN